MNSWGSQGCSPCLVYILQIPSLSRYHTICISQSSFLFLSFVSFHMSKSKQIHFTLELSREMYHDHSTCWLAIFSSFYSMSQNASKGSLGDVFLETMRWREPPQMKVQDGKCKSESYLIPPLSLSLPSSPSYILNFSLSHSPAFFLPIFEGSKYLFQEDY